MSRVGVSETARRPLAVNLIPRRLPIVRQHRRAAILKVLAETISNRGSTMKATRLLTAGAIAALLPLAGAFAQSPTPDPATQPSAPAQETPTQPAPKGGGATFESLDANSDGKISKDEAAANPNVSAQFSHYDKN